MIKAREEPCGLADEPSNVSPSAPFFATAKQPDHGTYEDYHPCLRYEIKSFNVLFIKFEKQDPSHHRADCGFYLNPGIDDLSF